MASAFHIDRGVGASHELVPHFRMGVREAWTWSRRDGVHLWTANPKSVPESRESDRSPVLPGLHRDDLDGLLAAPSLSEASRRARTLARRVARAMLAGRAAG